MASSSDWSVAYLAQSREDLEGARIVAASGIAPSVTAMLLQMAFEKLAKAALLKTGAVTLASVRKTHKAASAMLRTLRVQRGILEPLGGTKSWEDVLWVVEELERFHPQLAQEHMGTLEYPWETIDGTIRWPAAHLPIVHSLAHSTLRIRVVNFATLLQQRFDQIFG
jgi:hypothetical protein